MVSFMIDIVPMAASAAILVAQAIHALQTVSGQRGDAAQTRRHLFAIGLAFFAVYVPWAMMEFGRPHGEVWAVWALLFGSMCTIFGVVAFILMVVEGVFWSRAGMNLVAALVCILSGLGCTVHSFMPGLCHGWRQLIPLHAMWHFCSAVTANRCGQVLDFLTQLTEAMETAMQSSASSGKSPGSTKRAPLLLRLTRDALPSQFSM